MSGKKMAQFYRYSRRGLYELWTSGAQGRSRTTDTAIFNRLLYH